MPIDFDTRQFASAIEGLVCGILSQGGDDSGLAATRLVHELSERVAREQVGTDDRIECRAGCGDCCIVNVDVLLPEAETIVAYLVDTRSKEELNELGEALARLDRETRWLDDEERIMNRKKCAFLDQEGCCSIYPARPLLCRSVTSTDAAACREALAMIALGENLPVIANLTQRNIYETAFSSFGNALAKHGKDHRSYRLASSVRQKLTHKLD